MLDTRAYKPLKTRKQGETLLSPTLLAALAELAGHEGVPLATLISCLLNEALGARLARRGES